MNNDSRIQVTPLQTKLLEESLHELRLPIRTINALEQHANVLTIGDLLQKRAEDLLALPNFGKKTLETIYEALAEFGFYRKGSKQQKAKEEADARRNQLRQMFGEAAVDDWNAEIVYSRARAGKRKKL